MGMSSVIDAPVAIVIPCYNQARFLTDAVASVRRQANRDVEIIIVDDGSTDDTAAIAATLPGVRLISQSNRGLAAARNSGWRACTVPYVAFLDADDLLLPGALEAGLRHLMRQPDAAFVWGRHGYIMRDGTRRTPPSPPLTEPLYRALLRRNVIAMHAAVLYRREALDACGGFDAELPACEDYDLYLRLARTHATAAHGEMVAEYRFHDANMSANGALMLRTSLAVLKRQKAHVRRDPALRDAYREGLRFWRQLFGDQLLEQVVRAAKAHRWSGAARSLAVLLRHAPLRLVPYVRYRLLGFGRAAGV